MIKKGKNASLYAESIIHVFGDTRDCSWGNAINRKKKKRTKFSISTTYIKLKQKLLRTFSLATKIFGDSQKNFPNRYDEIFVKELTKFSSAQFILFIYFNLFPPPPALLRYIWPIPLCTERIRYTSFQMIRRG